MSLEEGTLFFQGGGEVGVDVAQCEAASATGLLDEVVCSVQT